MAEPSARLAVVLLAALVACAGPIRAAESRSPSPTPSPASSPTPASAPSPTGDSVLTGTDSLSSSSSDPGYEAGRRQAAGQAQRVRLSAGMRCADASTQLLSPERVKASSDAWGSPPDDPRYGPPEMISRTPVARYPAELLSAGVPGAVGLLLYINAEGSVTRTEAVCATDPAFVALAEQVVRGNRYSPSTFDGRPVRDMAFQIVAYGVAEN